MPLVVEDDLPGQYDHQRPTLSSVTAASFVPHFAAIASFCTGRTKIFAVIIIFPVRNKADCEREMDQPSPVPDIMPDLHVHEEVKLPRGERSAGDSDWKMTSLLDLRRPASKRPPPPPRRRVAAASGSGIECIRARPSVRRVYLRAKSAQRPPSASASPSSLRGGGSWGH